MKTESRKEKMEKIQEKLLNSTKEIFASENYKKYIQTMAKFPKYSINNCILIAYQCPTATFVCGYNKWKNDFKRTVNRNEKGIMIFAPIPRRIETEKDVIDSEGNKSQEKKIIEFCFYKPVYVFDVQQTSGKDLPEIIKILDSKIDNYNTLKETLIKVSPVPITFENFDTRANGYYSPSEERIVVKNNLPELQTIKTMLHEIAHASLKHGNKINKKDKDITMVDRHCAEVQAESVAFWVSSMLNLDTSDYSFGYIAGWSKSKEATELKESLEIIKSTADKIYTDIEKILSKKQ